MTEPKPEPITQDFGSSELNEVYAKLDGPTKEKIDKIKNEKIKINLLKDISNPELNDLFNSLSTAKQKEYEDFGLRDKYLLLKEMLESKKKNDLKQSAQPFLKEEENPLPVNMNVTMEEELPQQVLNKEKEKEKEKAKKPVIIKRSKINVNELMEQANLEEADMNKMKGIPDDFFEIEDKEIYNKKEQTPPQILFDNLVKIYYASNPHIFHSTSSKERLR